MTITAKVIEDSVSPEGIRLTTFELFYPRIVHADFMTHRVLSRNASSSRATPSYIAITAALRNPAEPFEWGANQPGMQAGKELTGFRRWMARRGWHLAKWGAAAGAYLVHKAGAHKQIVNRIMEPWSHIRVVVTATDWGNFFALRHHGDADPTLRELARVMLVARGDSQPKLLQPGEWHLPYVSQAERELYDIEILCKISAARCARVSYRLHDGKPTTVEKDLALFDRLMGGDPKHSSPTEHQATPDKKWSRGRWAKPEQHGNLRGYIQFRKTIPGEAVHEL
ncbi:hypothetical protein MHM88_14250 [Epibacterium sp. MM17-32]|uniref:hypothetical protein n=1 Tax=Epibacterium sp. MM17-32 TaxID=2917734 RepID=UPI001EF564B1|nr:hypothetical protein [Epibacterium sp. MM17-32]MCG7628969.1 hypothetical protein [Epibacterium sp. MM17-32]